MQRWAEKQKGDLEGKRDRKAEEERKEREVRKQHEKVVERGSGT